jgi:hypothetical protein
MFEFLRKTKATPAKQPTKAAVKKVTKAAKAAPAKQRTRRLDNPDRF